MRGLEAKRVLITGGASGIGAATAARFLEEGSAVCVLDRDADARHRIMHELPDLAGTLDADVSNLKQVQAAFADAIKVMGGVDVLINNAGISIRHDFLEITPEEWDKVIAVNLTGVFYMAQTAAQHMMERDGGVILQTASTNGIMGYPFYADYNATKAGVIELTKSMALELAPKVRVCAVAPGYVLTPMQRAEYTDAMLEEVNRKIPLRRHAQPEELPRFSRFSLPTTRATLPARSTLRRRRNCRRAGQPLIMPHAGLILMEKCTDYGRRVRHRTRYRAVVCARRRSRGHRRCKPTKPAPCRPMRSCSPAGGPSSKPAMSPSAADCRRFVERVDPRVRPYRRVVQQCRHHPASHRHRHLSEDNWDRVMAVNVKSIYLLSREVIPHMQKQGAGSIVNTSSGWGLGRRREGRGVLRFEGCGGAC